MASAGRARPAPVSTYRLQLQPGFGFAHAAGIAGYLASLGVSHVYLSPILQAVPGSRHGYDVVDHSRISADLGGEPAFRTMVARFREHGLGVIADIVPNHMAIPAPESLNRQLWSVLRDGTGSPYAHWFDVDWAAEDGRLLLPVLAGPLRDCVGEITLNRSADGDPVLRYQSHELPVRRGTDGLALPALLTAQHYRLADWRAAATQLNWRRFFDVTSLIAVRVEDEDVFAATHGLLLRLVAEGLIDGLRVDHPDGLADPRGYLDRLAAATGDAWVVTEKILTGAEELPRNWQCAGTTGYDALGAVGGLFLDPAGAGPLTTTYTRFTEGTPRFADVAEIAKREVARGSLAAEGYRMARLLAHSPDPVLGELSFTDLHAVLTELLTAVPVYRAYVMPGEPPPAASAGIVTDAAASASHRLPPRLRRALAEVSLLALGRAGEGAWAGEFIVRFQQTCGPVMAKGVEDTAFYRWSRLTALNEVGGDPSSLGLAPDGFHAFAARLARNWPATMTTLSTHDTKRQEDVRARLAVLAEIPRQWAAQAARWHDRAVALAPGPEPETEYLLWQTLLGAWPLPRDRAAQYLVKAMREEKTRTSWTDPDTGYEAAALAFTEAVLGDAELTASIAGFASDIAPEARVNSLGAKLVQLTMPGVPDVYQGCELAGFALVDPDNRRLVDYSRRRDLLNALDEGGRWTGAGAGRGRALDGGGREARGREKHGDGREARGREKHGDGREARGREKQSAGSPATDLDAEKLLVTARTLRLRRDHPDWFAGDYTPLSAAGPAATHAVAFRRGPAITVATRLPAGLQQRGGWADTVLDVPETRWRDVLTGATHAGPHLLLSQLAERLPVALLVPDGA